MSRSHPPKLALALLTRLVPDSEPLAGDLIEGFAVTQSRYWFWRQVLFAIVITPFHRDPEIRPLRLVDYESRSGDRRTLDGSRRFRQTINLTASPIRGIGGLSLACLGLIVAVTRPGALLILLGGVVGGALLGIVMVAISRHRVQSQTSGGPESVLFGRQD